jgi:glycosyltransferase involved in cell wall biosynthesis
LLTIFIIILFIKIGHQSTLILPKLFPQKSHSKGKILLMKDEKVSVIIPVYNEGSTIGNLVSRIKSCYPDFDVIVINDGSTDGTADAARLAGARVYSHPYNIGNGAAIKSGIRVAGGDILVFMDGDGQHNPEDIAGLLRFLPEHDMVVGARPNTGQASLSRALGNKIYNWFASYVAKFPIKDLTSGFRAIRSGIAQNFLYLLPNTYSYPTTLTLGVLRSGMSVKYVPITIRKRKTGQSNIKLTDGVRFFIIITRICTLFSPMRIFLPVSFAMFLMGVINYLYTYIIQNRFTNMSVFMFVAAIIIFMMSLISEQICQMRFERRGADRSLLESDSAKSDGHRR